MIFTPYASSSAGNLYTADDGQSRIMIECGLPWREVRRLLDFQTSGISGVLLTHAHLDHAKGASGAAKAGLDVYASQATLDALGLSGHRFHTIEARRQFQLGTWNVLPFETVHEGEIGDTLGFLLASGAERLLFLTDTCYSPVRFSGLTHVAIECNYAGDILDSNVRAGDVNPGLRRRIARSHMSLSTVKEMLLANDLSRVREIWLLHLSDGNSDAERFRREVQEATGKPVYVTGADC